VDQAVKVKNACQACGAARLREIAGFGELPRVTSDSKPFRPGGRLFVCEGCGLTQKIVEQQWLDEIGEIYRDYEMYHQSAAVDQAVFLDGRAIGRCEALARRLLESRALPASGSLLDVGAGSGAMLAAFSAACPQWKLYGLDLDNRKEQALRKIRGFEKLFTVPPAEVPEQFDLITVIHSLEHFTVPVAMLRSLRSSLRRGGRLFVQVNNLDKMPFDLVVADHLCHFTPRSLGYLVAQAGLGSETGAAAWITKEISLLCSADAGRLAADPESPQHAITRVEAEVGWLRAMLAQAKQLCNGRHFGIFGTSVAGTWLAAGLGHAVKFFVDEDPAREGRLHLGKPILRPDQVENGSVLYLAFAPEVADAISRRLGDGPYKLAKPPALAA